MIFADHAALKHVSKKKRKPSLIRQVLLLEEFHLEIKNRKELASHLLRILTQCTDNSDGFHDYFPDK